MLEPMYADPGVDPDIAFDAYGNAIAVWTQLTNTLYAPNVLNIFASRYTPATGWGEAEPIEFVNAFNASDVDVDVDRWGTHAIAVWTQSDGASESVWANRFTIQGGWQAPTLLETNNTHSASHVRVDVNDVGGAMAVWSLYAAAPSRADVWAVEYNRSTGWGAPVIAEATNTTEDFNPEIALDNEGNAVLVWIDYNRTTFNNNAWANVYTPASGWGPGERLELDYDLSQDPRVAFDRNNNATVVFQRFDGARMNVVSRSFSAAAGWGPIIALEDDATGNATEPRMAVNASGEVAVAWLWRNGTQEDLWTNRFTPGAGWQTAAAMGRIAAVDVLGANLNFDGHGNLFLVWQEHFAADGEAWWTCARPGQPWEEPALLADGGAGFVIGPIVAGDPSGGAWAVWAEYDGVLVDLWMSRFAFEDVTPPTLGISNPNGGNVYFTFYPYILIQGSTERGALLFVNGVAAYVDPHGAFGVLVPVGDEYNLVRFVAVDAAGNQAVMDAEVYYYDPFVQTYQDLDDARANISALESALAATREMLSSTGAELALAQSNATAAAALLASLEQNGTTTQAELSAARTNLTAAEAQVAALSAELAVAQGASSNMTARITTLEAQVDALEAAGNMAPPPDNASGMALAMAIVAVISALAALAVTLLRGRGPRPNEPRAGAPPKDP